MANDRQRTWISFWGSRVQWTVRSMIDMVRGSVILLYAACLVWHLDRDFVSNIARFHPNPNEERTGLWHGSGPDGPTSGVACPLQGMSVKSPASLSVRTWRQNTGSQRRHDMMAPSTSVRCRREVRV